MKLAPSAFALLLIISLGFSLWNQTLIINATDMHGLPLEAAQVSITYQKASSLSEDDGLLSGVTGKNGLFSAPLENKVPPLQQSYKVKVTVYTSYWEGETRIMELNNSDPQTFVNGTDPRNFTFMVPVELEQAYIEVLSSTHAPVSGADVVIAADAQLKRSTGGHGEASFLLPKGMVFSGTAAFGNLSKQFSTAEADESGGIKTITVVLPETPVAEPPSAASGLALTINFANGSSVAAHAFNYTFGGSTFTASTDSSGTATLALGAAGPLEIAIAQNEYDYRYTVDYSGQKEHSITLQPLLQISSFYSEPDGADCYRVIANVSDPRITLPLDVKMERYGKLTNVTLPVSGDAGGIFTSRLCIQAETKVVVRASNKYEAAGAVLALVPATGGFGPIAPSTPAKPAAPAKISTPVEVEKLFLPALLIGILAGIVLAFVFARRYIYMVPRLVAQYLYKLIRDMRKTRGKPPAGPPSE